MAKVMSFQNLSLKELISMASLSLVVLSDNWFVVSEMSGTSENIIVFIPDVHVIVTYYA